MTHYIQRVAHRGGALLAPENTLAAFQQALSLNVDAIELDVQVSRDGVPVVFHDNTVDRLTDGTGNLLDLDAAALHALNVTAHFSTGWPQVEHIPTLHEALVFLRQQPETRIYIELKMSKRDGVQGRYSQISEKVIAQVQELAMEKQVLVISFDWHLLAQVKELAPSIATGAIVSRDQWAVHHSSALNDVCERVVAIGASWICVDHRQFFEEMPALVHQHQLRLNIWTVNTLEALRHFTTTDIDSLTSDRPDFFTQL